MAKLSREQIAMYARSAGLSGGSVDIAVAVALAESGGNPRAHNPVPPDNSYGLWQINMLGSLGPDRRRKLGITSNSALFDPAVNARAMAMISGNGSNWQPWSTYTNGAYRKHMSGGGGVDQAGLVGPGLEGLAAGATVLDVPGAEGLAAGAELAIGAGEWMSDPDNWIRVAQVLLGVGLVYVGLVLAVKGSAAPLVAQGKALASQAPGGAAFKGRRAAVRTTNADAARRRAAAAKRGSGNG